LVLGEPGMCCAVEISVAPVAGGKNQKTWMKTQMESGPGAETRCDVTQSSLT
jgi:hypothetical protein